MAFSTPPQPPSDELDRRLSFNSFVSEVYDIEPVKAYRPGGFHPVHFGDLLHHGRYGIIRKLGYGAFSTAWLAKDTLNSHYVAIKIKSAETSMHNDTELSILTYLKQQGNSDPMSRHVVTFLDSFEHQGPNGKHVCIVFEPLSAGVSSLVDQIGYHNGIASIYPTFMAKEILRQVLIGICFLHSHGVIHGNIHLNSILFEVPNLDSYTEEELEHESSKVVHLVTRPDGTLDKSAPRYIPIAWPLIEHSSDFSVKITDLGGAFKSADISKNPATPNCLRAPERLFDCPLDQTIDIWSFGCLVFELLIGRALFPVMPDEPDDCHLLEIIDQLGPLPDRLLSQWDRSHLYFRPNGEQFNSMVDRPGNIELLEKDESFETIFHYGKEASIDDEEEKLVIDLLRRILRYEPEERPSAEELLSHPWFFYEE